MTEGYHIRTMSRRDIDEAIDWAAAEGWNPGLHDDDCFFAADHQGFLIGELDGDPIATISCVSYGERFGFIGFYIVRPEYRGRGLGLKIWQAAMARLQGRVIGLDGVLAQQDNYRKSGFSLAYRNVRYQGVSTAAGPDARQVVDLMQLPLEAVARYDAQHFQAGRESFLKHWIAAPGHMALGWLVDGELAGYGVIRPCREGFKIGPLFANTPQIAESLFRALSARTPEGSSLFLDVPEPNTQAVAMAVHHGMAVVFETARMYTAKPPSVALGEVYGVTSFELG